MKVVDLFLNEDSSTEQEALLLHPDGSARYESHSVLVEHALEVTVNMIPTMRIVCTPDRLAELVIGRLFTSGIIAGIEDVHELKIDEQGRHASVLLACDKADFSHRGIETVPTTGTGKCTYNTYFTTSKEPQKVTPIPWKIEWIFSAACVFAQDTPLHKVTTGTHSCYLMIGNKIIACCEDLGRHNAFDKVIGTALLQKVDLRRALIFSSGRLPEDMVMKAIRGGIPLLATKAVPTDETIRLARKYDLTLICQARPDSATVYNDPFGSACAGVPKKEGSSHDE